MTQFRFRPSAGFIRGLAPAVLTALLFLTPSGLEAQTQQQIQQQIEALGLENMTPTQIRQRLSQMGFDPSLLDSYLQASGPPGSQPLPPQASDALRALTAQMEEQPVDTRERDLPPPDRTEMEEEADLRVFGLRTFTRASSQFMPMSAGPVPPGYVLGPGDEVVLILTGDVEQQLQLPVTREGFLVIPQAGKIWVNGMTMAELRDRLYTVLGRVYSGVSRGPEATTHFEASLGRLRSNQVYVTGEVRLPGAYMTSALASVLNALYLAGGPLPTGSFRNVKLRRNGELVETIDLYDYLTRGNNLGDLTLHPGDVIFVPPAGPQVAVRGAVTREALYELRDEETILDAIQFAGGLSAPAALGRARITRILPPSQRTEPGVDRTVLDVDLASVIRGEAPAFELYDGDQLRIFRVRSEIRKIVTVSGAVWKDCSVAPVRPRTPEQQQAEARAREERAEEEREEREAEARTRPDSLAVFADTAARGASGASGARGANGRNGGRAVERERTTQRRAAETSCTFHYAPGMRAWDAIDAAEGLRPEAYRRHAQIVRVDPQDSTLSIISFSLETEPDGTPVQNPALAEFDAIRVFSHTDFQDSLAVRLSGEVRRPGDGTFQYREGMTLEDLLLQAGGLTPEADLMIEVSRRPGAAERRQGRLAEMVRIPVDQSYIISEEGIRFYAGDEENGDNGDGPDPSRFVLRPHDQVFVRRVPHLSETERTIKIEGEVTYPGVYALRSKDERLSQIIERAGGLANTAFPGGFRLYRNGDLVNIELPSVLHDPGGENDLILLPGDSMVVPEYDPVVLVQGAVNSPAAVLYKEGAGLNYYISNAGGYARNADRDHVNVRFANGEGAVRDKILFFSRSPKPGPGSTVNVPFIPESERGDLLGTLGDVAQVAGSVLTTLLLLTRF